MEAEAKPCTKANACAPASASPPATADARRAAGFMSVAAEEDECALELWLPWPP